MVEVPGVLGEQLAYVIGQLSYDPEVHIAYCVAGQDNDVRRMDIGVEIAVHVDLVEHIPVDVLRYALQVIPSRRQVVQVSRVVIPDGLYDIVE